jgi:O-antigen ligase
MFNKAAEKTTAQLIFIGAPLTTLFLITDTVTDPVNATKLLMAGGLGFGLLMVYLGFNLKSNFKNFRALTIAVILFILSMCVSVANSDSPFVQNLYGDFGRNTGFVTYLTLSFITLGALNLREIANFKKIIWGLQFAGIINVLYCSWVLAFGDFLSWNNPYKKILGLFGNPDFISAFLGIFIASLVAYAFAPGQSWKYRFAAAVTSAVAFFQIQQSHAIQGIAVTVAGIGFVGFYLVRSRFNSNIYSLGYLVFSFILGLLALFGTLQKGPFSFVYKRSVSLRGTYWNTAISMGSDHPFTGVGMDSYADWYRRARPPIALIDMPGPNTTSNAAHNVILDFFAYGGWPLFLSYIAILAIGGVAIFKLTLRNKKYDGVFVTLATAWACYQLQSVISINQIGLAIWGWLLTGALVAYEFATRTQEEPDATKNVTKGRVTNKANAGVVSPQILAGLGIVIGLIVACPPLSADTKWRSALDSKDANKVIAALEPSYLSPGDSLRYAQATQLLASSNLLPQAYQVALDAVAFNPDSYDNWRNLYFLSNSTAEEKALAVKNMQRLDPLNPDVTKP